MIDNRTNHEIVAEVLENHGKDYEYGMTPAGFMEDQILRELRAAGRISSPPSEDAVERAVNAAWAKSRDFRGIGGQAEFNPPWEFEQIIRAALIAAGAAPLPTEEEIAQVIGRRLSYASIHWDIFNPAMHEAVAQAVRALMEGER